MCELRVGCGGKVLIAETLDSKSLVSIFWGWLAAEGRGAAHGGTPGYGAPDCGAAELVDELGLGEDRGAQLAGEGVQGGSGASGARFELLHGWLVPLVSGG
jgi:hypothetical protein